ncbi:MAG: cyclic nucleotide-binding domain-containing protein [Candidatus Methylacidiphilales bacterium]|nr:cyclic nucleotide-binding domain-containing protein [Candidatus Methylacidiphilales bacterium]
MSAVYLAWPERSAGLIPLGVLENDPPEHFRLAADRAIELLKRARTKRNQPLQPNLPMQLQTGFLLADQALKKASCRREIGVGETIFTEGAPASGLFVVLSGKVEILKATPEGEVKLNEVGPDGIFGEMGLISEGGVRSATARAAEPTVLLEVRNNPIQMLSEMGDVYAALALLKQLICVLSEWLRTQNNHVDSTNDPSVVTRDKAGIEAVGIIKANLPKDTFKFFPKEEQLVDGQFLCRQGEPSQGFFFIHRGVLEILKSDDAQGGEHVIGSMRGPTVAGEVAYFSDQPRLVSLRASGPVTFSIFSGYDYELLKETKPEKALEVLFAAAQCIVALLGRR